MTDSSQSAPVNKTSTRKPGAQIITAAQMVKALILDVDGVLTDGKLYYGNEGEELKAFNIQDGLGIKLLQRAGIKVGIITARTSAVVSRRSEELGIDLLIQGREDKLNALQEIIAEQSLPCTLTEIAYMGDDLPDLPVIRKVGLGMTVANASTTVAQHAQWQSGFPGGSGAVREAAELILNAQNKLESVLADYLQ